MYDIQLVLSGMLTAYLIFRCFWACREQHAPTPLYRVLRDEADGGPVEQIVVSQSTCRRSQTPDMETPPPSPWWNFDNMRPPRAPRSFVGPTIHGAARGPLHSPDGPPPPYSRTVYDMHVVDEPPPTYQQVVNLQQQEEANITTNT